MGVWNSVYLRDIKNRVRIEAEFYRPEFLACEKLIESIPYVRLASARRKITDGTHFTPRYMDCGVRFYSAVNVKEGYFDQDSFKFISASEHREIHRRCPVRAGDVLLRKVGVGPRWSCVVPEGLDEFSIFVSVAMIRPSDTLKPEYLSTFMNCRYGQLQLLRLNKGISQPDLHLEDIAELLVPTLTPGDQIAVTNLVRDSQNLRDQSRALYVAARGLLESELGLDKLAFQKPVGYTTRFSDIETSRRFDPEHYYPAFEAFANSLPPGISLSPLNRHLTFCQRGQQPIYSATGLRVINSKHVQPNRVLLEDNRFAAANPDGNLQIRAGDTLLNGTGRGTLGRAAPYLIEERAVPDNHVTILRSDDLDPVYLSLFLNSAAGQMQVEMRQRGSSGQLELYPFDIRKFLVWPAPESLQQELRRLHDQAAAAERESRQLLEQAKTRVEQLIEEAART